jgi:hypothetical protein
MRTVFAMTDTRPKNTFKISEASQSKIPLAVAEEIRHLSHDLSNALEVVIQTNYLLGMANSGADDENRKWRAMLDQGVMQATEINRQLRDFVRAHS